MDDVPFLGMRGTGDWVTNQRPENWREMILRLYPNGQAPLTAMMSKFSSEKTDDPVFHWWTKKLATQSTDLIELYVDGAMTVPYVHGGVAGDILYANIAAADMDKFMVGHQVLLSYSIDPTTRCNAKVVDRHEAGVNSSLAVRLLEADDNGTFNMALADNINIIGSIFPEGSNAPQSIMYDPVEYSNCTQIFRNTLEHTRTAMRTRLRTGDQVKEAKRECLELHSIEMEKASIFGVRSSRAGDNGKPERTTAGILSAIATNVFNYPVDYAAAWLTSGELWMDECLEQLFRYGKNERLIYCGSGALLGLNRLAKNIGEWQWGAQTVSYGIKVAQWVTPFGTVYLKTHPLFNYEPNWRHMMIAVSPENLIWRYIDDTKYQPKLQDNDLDGEKSGYLAEGGFELHHEETFAVFYGVGLDNIGGLATTPAPTTLGTTYPPTTELTTLDTTVLPTALTAAPTTVTTTAAPTTTLTTAAPTTTATTAGA